MRYSNDLLQWSLKIYMLSSERKVGDTANFKIGTNANVGICANVGIFANLKVGKNANVGVFRKNTWLLTVVNRG